jgi:hypothetical protein
VLTWTVSFFAHPQPTTSEDPVIQELASKDTATIYTTDAILSVLMCAPRSVNSWDIVMVREGDKLFLDKREGGAFGSLPSSLSSSILYLTFFAC